MAYTSSDQPSSITSSNATVHFSYGSESQRLQQLGPNGRTIYLHPDNQGGLFYEKFIRPDGQVEHQHFVMVDNQLVAIINQTEAGSVVRYVHQDHLGSIVALTDEAGTVVERFAYDVYGQRRAVPGTANNNLAGSATNRGYTGAEHLDAVGLIHLNGRLLDPATGRFLTADPNIPYPLDSQSFNRYSYVRNNPLSFIDPSGFEDIDSGGSYSALASLGTDLTVSISSARSSINNVTNSIANSGLFNWDFSGISS